MNFFVSEDHCFGYGKPLAERGQGRGAPDANNGISHMWPKSSSSEQDEAEEDDYDEMQEYINLFCDKETMPFFKKSDHTPPFSEWNDANDLLEAAPDFKKYERPPNKLKSHGKRVQMHFCHRNLESFEKYLRDAVRNCQNVSVGTKYGSSPDKPTKLCIRADKCPMFVVHAVPTECDLLKNFR